MTSSYQYSFVTRWQLQAPLEQVWEVIYDSLMWPEWWKGVIKVEEIKTASGNGVGTIREYTWKGVLPYYLRFSMELTEMRQYSLLRGRSFGDLEGNGSWYFQQKGAICCIEYCWQVNATQKWMKRSAPVLRPLFIWNHNIAMTRGAKGLAQQLNASLLSY